MIVGILFWCVIIAISTLIHRIWSRDTLDYRKLLFLPKPVGDKLIKLVAKREAAQKEMEEYDEEDDN